MKKQIVNLSLSPEVVQSLDKAASLRGLSRSAMVNMILTDLFRERRDCDELTYSSNYSSECKGV